MAAAAFKRPGSQAASAFGFDFSLDRDGTASAPDGVASGQGAAPGTGAGGAGKGHAHAPTSAESEEFARKVRTDLQQPQLSNRTALHRKTTADKPCPAPVRMTLLPGTRAPKRSPLQHMPSGRCRSEILHPQNCIDLDFSSQQACTAGGGAQGGGGSQRRAERHRGAAAAGVARLWLDAAGPPDCLCAFGLGLAVPV